MSESSIEIWEPNEGFQTKILQRGEDEILASGGRMTGKSEALLAWMVEPEYINNPLYRGLVIRKQAKDLRDWIDRAKRFYRPLGCETKYQPVEFHFPSGAIIYTGHLQDSDATLDYQGHEYQKLGIEELTQIPEKTTYERLITCCRSTVPGLKPQIFCTSNPSGPGAWWVMERFIDFTEEGVPKATVDAEGNVKWRYWLNSTIEDCPQAYSHKSNIATLNSLTGPLKQAWRYGKWGIGEGAFFPEWQEEKDGKPWHVIEPNMSILHNAQYRIAGIDWGYRAPFVCLWFAVMPPPQQRVYLYRELVGTELLDSKQAALVMGYSMGEKIHEFRADPSCWNKRGDGRSISDVWEENGLFCVKAMNDRIGGAARVRELLVGINPYDQKPILQVFCSCKNFIRNFPRLQINPSNIEDVDTTGQDHEYDAARYALTSPMLAFLGEKTEREMPVYKTNIEQLNEYILAQRLRKKNTRHLLGRGNARATGLYGKHSW